MFKLRKSYLLIMALILSGLITLVIFLGYRSLESSKRMAINAFNNKQLILSERGANGIKLYLDSLSRETVAIAGADIIKLLIEDEARIELSRRYNELKSLGVTEITVTDINGNVIIATVDNNLEKTNISDDINFVNIMKIDDYEDVVIQKLQSRDRDDLNILKISSPIFSSSGFQGAVTLNLDFKELIRNQLKPLTASEGGHPILVDSDFQVLWLGDGDMIKESINTNLHNFDEEIRSIRSETAQLFNFSDLHANRPSAELSDNEKQKYYAAISPIKVSGSIWFLVIEAPQEEALLPLTNLVNNLLLMVAIVIILIGIGTTLFTIYLIRSRMRLEKEVVSRTRQIKKSEDNFRRIAEILQESLIAPISFIPSINIGVGYKPAKKPERVGGDFYDVFPLEDGKIALLIGDVAGKGIEAAAFTETIRSTIRAHATIDHSPSYVLNQTSISLIGRIRYFEYATCLYAVLDIHNKTLRLANAGHPQAIIFNNDNEKVNVKTGIPLGQLVSTYSESEIQLNEEACILLNTDGLYEARNGIDFFGDHRIKEIVENNLHLGSQGLVDLLLSSVTEYANGEISDDIALVIIRFSNQNIKNDQNIPIKFPKVREQIKY